MIVLLAGMLLSQTGANHYLTQLGLPDKVCEIIGLRWHIGSYQKAPIHQFMNSLQTHKT